MQLSVCVLNSQLSNVKDYKYVLHCDHWDKSNIIGVSFYFSQKRDFISAKNYEKIGFSIERLHYIRIKILLKCTTYNHPEIWQWLLQAEHLLTVVTWETWVD